MKYQKYLVLAFVAALFLPMLSAKSAESTTMEFDLNSLDYIELGGNSEIDFDTAEYLPDNFNPFDSNFTLESLNYIEDDTVDLGFDTSDYLPEEFNPYQK